MDDCAKFVEREIRRGKQYDAIINELEQLNQQLQEGCVHDTEAYCMIVDAFKLPKGTDEEKAARRAAVEAAAAGEQRKTA